MAFSVGQLVNHSKMGKGKVLNIEGGKMSVYFKDAASEQVRTYLEKVAPLSLAPEQSDPALDHIKFDVKAAAIRKRGPAKPKPARAAKPGADRTHEASIEFFRATFPGGFDDPKYTEDSKKGERCYKVKAHKQWEASLNKSTFQKMIEADQFAPAADLALQIEAPTNLLSRFERTALRAAVKDPQGAKDFATGVYDLIYGDSSPEERFNRFAVVLEKLPQPGSTTLTWPIQTVFPFLVFPETHLLLKPTATKKAAQRMGFSLNYQTRPNWLTYQCLLDLAARLKEDLASLGPRDMVDVQSFIYVTGEANYPAAK